MREALRLLLEHDFALILLDVRMPGLDGLETAQPDQGARAHARRPDRVPDRGATTTSGTSSAATASAPSTTCSSRSIRELLRSKVAVFAELEQSRRALKRSEAFLRGAFEAAPIGKTLLDADRRIVRANPAFARLLGRSPAEAHGLAIADLCHARGSPGRCPTVLDSVSRQDFPSGEADREQVDLRLRAGGGRRARGSGSSRHRSRQPNSPNRCCWPSGST